MQKRLVSIIVPIFNESANLPALAKLFQELAARVTQYRFEIILVDDGSADNSFEVAREQMQNLPSARLVRLSRNYGSHAAIMCGYSESKGDCAVFLSGDLQDPPAVITEMLKHWEEGTKIVWAARTNTKLASSVSYWTIANWQTGGKFPASGVDFALIDRTVVEKLKEQAHRDACIFMQIVSHDRDGVVVRFERQPRGGGKSGWTLSKKLALVWRALVFTPKTAVLMLVVSACLLLMRLLLFMVAQASTGSTHTLLMVLAECFLFLVFSSLFVAILLLVGYVRALTPHMQGQLRFTVAEMVLFKQED